MIYQGHIDCDEKIHTKINQTAMFPRRPINKYCFLSTAEAADSNIFQQEESHVWYVFNESQIYNLIRKSEYSSHTENTEP